MTEILDEARQPTEAALINAAIFASLDSSLDQAAADAINEFTRLKLQEATRREPIRRAFIQAFGNPHE